MFIPRFNITEKLKEYGYNSSRILKEMTFGQSVYGDIRHNKAVASDAVLDRLCSIFHLQPSDIYRYISEDEYERLKALGLLKPYEEIKE